LAAKILFSEDVYYKKIIGKVDFCVLPKKNRNQSELFKEQSLLWAEAKANKHNIIAMFAQLILTIGKARTFNEHFPPAFLGVFDAEKIAFVPYEKVSYLFHKNDFNWNVAPSNHNTKEFAEIKELINDTLEREKYLYYFGKDDKNLQFFVKQNLAKGSEESRIQIDVNNFKWVFDEWIEKVKPLINYSFDKDKQQRILDLNFFLADLFVDDKNTTTINDDEPINEDIFVVFRNGRYEIDQEKARTLFKNQLFDVGTLKYGIKNKTAYENFWKHYKRPPNKIYQNLILERKDLLVSDDVRERKGAFFTPKQWVRLSQKYIADVLGENWQQEYYIWDCCAGTGNLLDGLTNKYNIYASTLDQGDVQVMKSQVNLLENHVFQFDFLNDEFFDTEKDTYDIDTGEKIGKRFVKSKLPQSLQEIFKDPKKRKKLVIYINPPYAESGTTRTMMGTGEHKTKVATDNKTYRKYKGEIGKASNELFAQFLIRIYKEIPTCIIANFSKLKSLQAPNFLDFRKEFQAKLEKLFLIPAATFDNVKGSFPIGFFVWNTAKKEYFKEIKTDVYDEKGSKLGNKKIINFDDSKYISDWLAEHSKNMQTEAIGILFSSGNDFQNQRNLFIENVNSGRQKGGRHTLIYDENLTIVSIYLSVRYCVKPTWLNDRDQFLYPKKSWKADKSFHNDCLLFTLFNVNIKSRFGANHWIPFTEQEVNAQERFASDFMSRFIAGQIKKSNGNGDLFNKPKVENGTKCKFSPEAQEVFDAGKELWRYYHAQKDINVNASFYDIREYFQGRNEKTNRMNNSSTDQKYNELIGVLREKLKILANKIAEKVYLHEFLKE